LVIDSHGCYPTGPAHQRPKFKDKPETKVTLPWLPDQGKRALPLRRKVSG